MSLVYLAHFRFNNTGRTVQVGAVEERPNLEHFNGWLIIWQGSRSPESLSNQHHSACTNRKYVKFDWIIEQTVTRMQSVRILRIVRVILNPVSNNNAPEVSRSFLIVFFELQKGQSRKVMGRPILEFSSPSENTIRLRVSSFQSGRRENVTFQSCNVSDCLITAIPKNF